jgi:hypothetical protein
MAATKRKCSCGKDIVFLRTSRPTRAMSVEPDSLSPGENDHTIFDPKRHVSHFATCPDAVKHRKPR